MTSKQWFALASSLVSIVIIYLLISLNFPKMSTKDLMTICILSVIGCPILFWYCFVKQLNPLKKLPPEQRAARGIDVLNKAFDSALPALNVVFLFIIVALIYFIYIV